MEKNTLQKLNSDFGETDFDKVDRELESQALSSIDDDSAGSRFVNPFIFITPLLAVLVIFLAQHFLSISLFRNNNEMIARDFPYTSLESPILQSAVREINKKRQEIDLKDIQIRRYQYRILEQDQKLTLLQGLMDESLKVKEQDLLAEIETAVGEERTRLENLGRNEEQINNSIDELRTDLETQYTKKMDAFRSNEMLIYQQKIEVLQNEREFLEDALNGAVEDRRDLVQTIESEESDLLGKLYEDNTIIDIVNAGVDADLEILKESRKFENYWLDELANQYLGLIESITEQDNERAKSHISTLEDLFESSTVLELAGIEARNEADRELIRFFAAYIDSMGPDEISTQLTETKLLAEQAIDHIRSARYQEAEIAWRKIFNIWPMIDRITSGYIDTRDTLVAADLREYANIAETSLLSGDYDQGSQTWRAGLTQIPDPVGSELRDFWTISERSNSERIEELNQMFFDIIAIEKEEASLRLDDLIRDNSNQRTEIRPSGESENRELINRIEAQNAELAILKEQLAESRLETIMAERSIRSDSISSQWRLYGVVVQRQGDNLVVEPLTDVIPAKSSVFRVMRPLGNDRVTHVANGSFLTATRFRASGSISPGSINLPTYSSPVTNDLVYLENP